MNCRILSLDFFLGPTPGAQILRFVSCVLHWSLVLQLGIDDNAINVVGGISMFEIEDEDEEEDSNGIKERFGVLGGEILLNV